MNLAGLFAVIAFFVFFQSCAKKVEAPAEKIPVEDESERLRKEKEEIIQKAAGIGFEEAKAELVPDPYVMFGLGLRKEEAGELEEAEKFYSYAIELKPNMAEAWINLANVQKKIVSEDKMIDTLRSAIEVIPDDPRIWAALAIAYSEKGENEKAEKILKDAVERVGMKEDIAKSLGYIFMQTKRYSLALFIFSELKRKNPNDPQISFLIGEIYMNTGNCVRAIENFNEGLKIKKDKSVLNNVGICLLKLDLTDEAKGAFEEAIKVDQNFWPAYMNLGLVYKRKGEFQKSEEMYKKALELNKNPDVIYNLANLYETMASYFRQSPQEALKYINLAKDYLKEYMNTSGEKEKEFIEKRIEKLEKSGEEIKRKLEREIKKPTTTQK